MLKEKIIQKSRDLGFSDIGFAKAEFMEEEARKLESWLNNGLHGQMSYMENYFDLRVDPSKLVPGAKTVISLAYNYYNPQKQEDTDAPKISMYAYGRDYHKVIRKKLKAFIKWIKEECGEVNGRGFVDSAPVLERDWARRSGVGWQGKHTLLLNPRKGSYFFLAELILDLEIPADAPIKDHCGTCTRCIDACPTDAISEKGYVLDSSRCISYLTIELKEDIPEAFSGLMDGWMYGCDICQHVCPWNRFSTPHTESDFNPKAELLELKKRDWEDITESIFNDLFEGSAVKRTKFKGLTRNIAFLNKA